MSFTGRLIRILTLLGVFGAAVTAVELAKNLRANEPAGLKLAVFDVDATPPVGVEMAYNTVRRVDELTLRCRGVVLLGSGEPIVLCAIDWIGVGNEGHDYFRAALAKAAGTSPSRVTVHSLHQHDAPACDLTAERLLIDAGIANTGRYASGFTRQVAERAAESVVAAVAKPTPVTEYGWGAADVQDVASNRRILGPDGKVRAVRYTATKDPELRAEPDGVIDPQVTLLSFWNGDKPLAVLSYYACHPQSYYRTGVPSPDFPGIARFVRGQALPETLHVHFNGAGGNIGAGKYNDGAYENRVALGMRLAQGMEAAWKSTKRFPLTASDVGWSVAPVALPPAAHLNEAQLRAALKQESPALYFGAVDQLSWLLRCQSGHKIDLSCLKVGSARVLHMPGELFVEYQLAAKRLRPDLQVSMAAYGDYGPGYIGTAVGYEQGGYETAPRSSGVAPAVEEVLMTGVKKLLEK